tara:strand:+ start:1013 stop:1423 length:411 start_codon:yes stop_codon:yes gene_type:complete
MKATKQLGNGTSFHGVTIRTRPIDLISLAKKLGADFQECNTGEDKCNFDFEFETSKGDVFTIYDWKEYRELAEDENVSFHIGAENRIISQTAKMELLAILNSAHAKHYREIMENTNGWRNRHQNFCPVEALQNKNN